MTIERIVEYASSSPMKFITIVTLLVTILSQFLVIIEYFRLKGRWDYYFLDDVARHTRNHGFNPEYLATSLFISAVLLFMLLNNHVRIIVCNAMCSSITIITVISITFITSFVIFYFFSKEDVDKGIRTKKELLKYVLEKSLFTAIKYFVFLLIFFLAYNLIIKNKLLSSMVLIVLGGVFEVLYEYCIAKNRTSRNRKFDIIAYENQEYCILERISTEKYYVVDMKTDEDTLTLYLDKRMLICPTSANVFTKNYKKVIRQYMNKIIIERKFTFW